MVDNNLTFIGHIYYVVAKESRQKLGILSRPFKSETSTITESATNRFYKSMILSLLEYCDITWYGCGLENQKKIDLYQKRAGRTVLKKLSGIDK